MQIFKNLSKIVCEFVGSVVRTGSELTPKVERFLAAPNPPGNRSAAKESAVRS